MTKKVQVDLINDSDLHFSWIVGLLVTMDALYDHWIKSGLATSAQCPSQFKYYRNVRVQVNPLKFKHNFLFTNCFGREVEVNFFIKIYFSNSDDIA